MRFATIALLISATAAIRLSADPGPSINWTKKALETGRIPDDKLSKEELAIRKAITAAKAKVELDPKIIAWRKSQNELLPDPLAPNEPMNPQSSMQSGQRKNRIAAKPDPGNPNVTGIAGPASTDQIGKSVYLSARAGMDGVPGPRNILTKGDPSFVPGDVPAIPWPAVATPADKAAAVVKADDEAVGTKPVDANVTTAAAVGDMVKANVDAALAAKSDSKNPADISNDPAYAVDKMDLETPIVSKVNEKISEAAEAKTAAALAVAVAEKPAKDAKAAADVVAAKAAEVADDAKKAEKKAAVAAKEAKETAEDVKDKEAVAKGEVAPAKAQAPAPTENLTADPGAADAAPAPAPAAAAKK